MLFHMSLPSIAGSEHSMVFADEAPMGVRTSGRQWGSGLIDRRHSGEVEESSSTPRTALCTKTGATVVRRRGGTERAG